MSTRTVSTPLTAPAGLRIGHDLHHAHQHVVPQQEASA